MPEEVTIHIFESVEGGFMYDIWLGDPVYATERPDSEDGGHCTSTFENALEMAKEQAVALLKSKQPQQ